jgi:hypothetical protein
MPTTGDKTAKYMGEPWKADLLVQNITSTVDTVFSGGGGGITRQCDGWISPSQVQKIYSSFPKMADAVSFENPASFKDTGSVQRQLRRVDQK